jgi:hypothetical protein
MKASTGCFRTFARIVLVTKRPIGPPGPDPAPTKTSVPAGVSARRQLGSVSFPPTSKMAS